MTHPLFKTNALCLAGNKGQVKRLLLQQLYSYMANTALPKSSLAVTSDAFYPYDTPTFKTNVFRLVSNEGRIKYPLMLLKPFLATHFVTRATPIVDIDGKR